MITSSFLIFLFATISITACGSPPNMRMLTWENAESNTWPPKFCNKLDCPFYTVLEELKAYEVRSYNVSRWVTTSERNLHYLEAESRMFMRLFDYISGHNNRRDRIAMTTPVLTTFIPKQGTLLCEEDFTMSFFISPKVGHPPVPTNSEVHINELKPLKVYVRYFSGFANTQDWLVQAEKLATSLPKSATYIKEYFIAAGYDSPFKLFDRHNEVWFIAKEM